MKCFSSVPDISARCRSQRYNAVHSVRTRPAARKTRAAGKRFPLVPSDREVVLSINEILAENIVSLRARSNLTQNELARKVGVSPQAVSKWERAICCPDISLLPAIAEVFRVDICALLCKGAGTGGAEK